MTEPVVLTGLGAVTSIGLDVRSFEQSLRAGTSGFTCVEDDTAEGGVGLLAPVLGFDFEAAVAGLDALPAARRDAILRVGRTAPESVQMTLSACGQAWQDAALDVAPLAADRIGIVVGGTNTTQRYVSDNREVYEEEPLYLSARYALHAQDSHVVASISEGLEILGEGYTVGASSASGNAAVMHAARLIACGAVDACLAVGAMTQLEPAMRAALAKLGVLASPADAPDDDSVGPRPLDRSRHGFVPGEAAACILLESRRSARLRDVEAIAELVGFAQALDGNSMPDPNVDGESRSMAKALHQAGLTGDRVDYVNAHATATPAGDDAEVEAMARVLDGGRPWVNATKGLIGHCLSAAGAIEALACAVQIRHHFVHPNPAIEAPVTTSALRVVGPTAVDADISCALSNSFGFGGFNSTLVLVGV